ncbi:transglutaminase-like cysteine peptidase [Methylobacterium nonmethylotrophicum]|uniref:Transglutaminase n=1 Tax=Methylobacterium nonmethylotrophicum TaxID=1141884 RepID=A0A4Z0NTI8_9HYPH|nr:transglutaminase-like cysteine peptidase [Methylobacterium nonmethylotrophicum]TGE00709.1 transglutaminase [Methylobacterium nonmethylotrophicum]
MTTGFGRAVKRVLVGAAMVSAAFLTAQGGGAAAQTLAALPMPSSGAQELGQARPIVGWVEFCARYAQECAVDVSEPAQISLTPRLWQTITTVNRQVNTSLRAVTDQEHWGVPDRWDLAEDGSGDCEDFQLLKRKLLAEAGLPRRAMRMTVVIDEKGEGHAVLMIRTDRGDLVLDNKTSAVLPWHRTGYTFIKRESQEAAAWVSLGGATAPTVTANR